MRGEGNGVEIEERPVTRGMFMAWLVASMGLLCWATATVIRTLNDSRVPLSHIYSADLIAPASLYETWIVEGYDLGSYKFSAANFAFPDCLLYFTVRPLVGQPGPAIAVWVGLFFGFIAFSSGVAGAAVLPRGSRRYLIPLIAGLSAAYLAGNSLDFFNRTAAAELLYPCYHGGALACTFLGLALSVVAVRARRRWVTWLTLGFLGLVCSLAIFSDRLFGIYFAPPIALSLGLFRCRYTPSVAFPLTWRRYISVLASVTFGCAAGLVAILAVNALLPYNDVIGAFWSGLQLDELPRRTELLTHQIAEECRFGNVFVIAGVLWYGVIAPTALIVGRRTERRGLDFYIVFSYFVLLSVLFAFLNSEIARKHLGQSSNWHVYSRYFVAPEGFGVFGPAVVLAHLVGSSAHRWVRIVLAGFPMLLALILLTLTIERKPAEPPTVDVLDYYPDYVQLADEAAEKYGPQRCLCGYWQAKPITLFSRAGVRADAVRTNPERPLGVEVHWWLSNGGTYWKPPKGRKLHEYHFVIAPLSGERDEFLLADEVVPLFGEPADQLTRGNYVLFVYNRLKDEPLRTFGTTHPSVRELRAKLEPEGP